MVSYVIHSVCRCTIRHDYLGDCIGVQLVHFNQFLCKIVVAIGRSKMQRGVSILALQLNYIHISWGFIDPVAMVKCRCA